MTALYFHHIKDLIFFELIPPIQILLNIKGIILAVIRRVLIIWMLRKVVFIGTKRPDAAQLQNTFSSVHNCDFVLCHQLLSQFLIVQSVGDFLAPVFGGIEAVDGFLPQ